MENKSDLTALRAAIDEIDYFAQMMRISREYQQHILKGEQ